MSHIGEQFNINNNVETSNHATYTNISDMKTLDLFQDTKEQQARVEGKERKCCLDNLIC